MENTLNIDEYVIVNTAGGRYIGKPYFGDNYLSDIIKTEGPMRDNVLVAMENGKVIELQGALDFMTPMRPVPGPNGQMALTRDLIVTSPDFTCEPISIHVTPQSIYFCSDLHEVDKKIIREHVGQALGNAKQERAARSGIKLVSGRG